MGGGSGGHVTPVVAVLRELRASHPRTEIRFWCDRKFYGHAKGIIHHFDPTLRVDMIFAGKLRRYHTLSWWQHLRPSILLSNIRDLLFVTLGFIQSFIKLLIWRPDVVFTKGGFVCLPVGAAAALLRIPLVIHDSDAHPGLTNRILSRWARTIATGAPLEYYNYPKSKSHYVGIPVATDCVPYSADQQLAVRRELGLDETRPLVVITGGGLGAKRLNDAVVTVLSSLLKHTNVILVSGSGQYDELAAITPQNDSLHFQLHAFVTPLTPMLGAADIVIARAGATTLLELAAMAKPTILVPNAALTGGHQLKNAAVYQEKGAVQVIDESELQREPQLLVRAVQDLLDDKKTRDGLSQAILGLATPRAAADLAELIVEATKR